MINLRYTVFIFLGILLDQLLKFAAIRFLSFDKALIIIHNIFSLQLVYNFGAAYGILQNQRWLLTIIGFLVLCFCFIFQKKIADTFLSKLGLSFFVMGALGNWLDRLFRGYVVDFLDIKIFPILNLSDISINIAILFFILGLFFDKQDEIKST
ncbi:signal peptidase II [bacterium]|jgi:signal peptidase II|nr:signal peptidase II [bacterium]MBT3581190.1 signal peptidase II [bacterium]MBT4551907.1 signal peptidase II [bacterium]MBT7087450.1 signal peptidase II [bacterium]